MFYWQRRNVTKGGRIGLTVAESARQRERVAPPERWATRELRLAVVCYGGVSLAIYMHGITKEI